MGVFYDLNFAIFAITFCFNLISCTFGSTKCLCVTRVLFVSLTGYDLDVLASEGLFFGRILSSEQLVYLTPPTLLDRYF